jgi:hypothetical protein
VDPDPDPDPEPNSGSGSTGTDLMEPGFNPKHCFRYAGASFCLNLETQKFSTRKIVRFGLNTGMVENPSAETGPSVAIFQLPITTFKNYFTVTLIRMATAKLKFSGVFFKGLERESALFFLYFNIY